MKKKETGISYTSAWQELQGILARLESGEVDVDALGAEVERAQVLLDYCRKALRSSKAIIDRFDDAQANHDSTTTT